MGFCLGPQLYSTDLRVCFCDSTMLVFCLFVYYDSVVDLESDNGDIASIVFVYYFFSYLETFMLPNMD